MRKLTGLLALALLLPLTALAEFSEGIHYQSYPEPFPVTTGDRIEVREVFWYGCPHCYHLEHYIDQWLQNKPANAEFVRMPGIFRDSWIPHARAYYAFEAMGITEKMHPALMNEMHEKKRRLTKPEEFADLVAANGFDRQAFVEAYGSFAVNTQSRQAAILSQRYGISGVPAIIVDGRFRTSASEAGGYEKLFELVDYLVELAAKERSAGTQTGN